MTANKGRGVFPKWDGQNPTFVKGDFVTEFIGTVWPVQTTVPDGTFCMVALPKREDDYILLCTDSEVAQNNAVFINHSCNPTCQIQGWNDSNGWPRVLIVALSTITTEEITVDYNMDTYEASELIVCKCNTVGCRKWIQKLCVSRSPVAHRPPIIGGHVVSIRADTISSVSLE